VVAGELGRVAPEPVVGREREPEAGIRGVVARLGHEATVGAGALGVAAGGDVVDATTVAPVQPPSGDTWIALSAEPLPVGAVTDWAVRPGCGGLVLFLGTVRDHAGGRTGVHRLEYEAYVEQAEPKLREVADEARRRWPVAGAIALLHRVGALELGDAAVVVAVSAPHRGEAFEAARWCIDTLKATVPIWKKEHWDGGADWGLAATDLAEVSEL